MTDHYCEIRYSKDGSHNHSDWTIHDLGDTGAFQTRVTKLRMGQAYQMAVTVRTSSPRRRNVLAMAVQVDKDS